jgi:hypothetical protein
MQNTGKSAPVMVSDVADTRRRFASIVDGLMFGSAAVPGPRRAGTP